MDRHLFDILWDVYRDVGGKQQYGSEADPGSGLHSRMVFPARYYYLSRIGALWPKPINALLNLDALARRRDC